MFHAICNKAALIFPKEDYNSIVRKKWQHYFAVLPVKKESLFLPLEFWFGHWICFGQWDISRHGINRGLARARSLGLVLCLVVLGTKLPHEKAQSRAGRHWRFVTQLLYCSSQTQKCKWAIQDQRTPGRSTSWLQCVSPGRTSGEAE